MGIERKYQLVIQNKIRKRGTLQEMSDQMFTWSAIFTNIRMEPS